jgi:hypothetical protein
VELVSFGASAGEGDDSTMAEWRRPDVDRRLEFASPRTM